MAGGDDGLIDSLKAIGLPLGEAFQLRDDDLGVFGDPAATGKPAGDDLREGKRTALLAFARESASASQLALIDRHLGDRRMSREIVSQLQQVVTDSGARARHETLISTKLSESLAALESAHLPAEAATLLRRHAHGLAHRDS